MTFAEKLQSLRQQHGLTQEALAEKLQLARQTVSKWESGQSTPELHSLLTLADLYGVSLDHLVRDDACSSAQSAPRPEHQDLIAFLLRAKRATYAGHGAETASSRTASHDFAYCEEPFSYLDSYVGGHRFAGEEVVWHNGTPIWSMNYAGRVLREPFSGDFLKEALRHCSVDLPYRGPQLYSHGDWTYYNHIDGCFTWFAGHEEIFYKDVLVYQCRYHGGVLE